MGMLLWEIFHLQLPYGGRDPLSVADEAAQHGTPPSQLSTSPLPTLSLPSPSSNSSLRCSSCHCCTPSTAYYGADYLLPGPSIQGIFPIPFPYPLSLLVCLFIVLVSIYKNQQKLRRLIIAFLGHRNVLLRALYICKGYEVSSHDYSFCIFFQNQSKNKAKTKSSLTL